MRIGFALIIVLFLVMASAAAFTQAPRYSIQLVPFSGWILNDRGEIAGDVLAKNRRKNSRKPDLPAMHLAVWRSGRVRDLGLLPDNDVTTPSAMNNRGQIVGDGGRYQYMPGDEISVDLFFWTGRKLVVLMKYGYALQEVWAINDSAQAVGTVSYQNAQKGFVYDHGRLRVIDDPLGGDMCEITDINDNGDMVGLAADPHVKGSDGTPLLRLIEWQEGKANVIPTPADIELGQYTTIPKINRTGDIIFDGWQSGHPEIERAYVWHSGALTEVGPLPGYPITVLDAINDQGIAIGSSSRLNPRVNGKPSPAQVYVGGPCFLWKNGKVADLQYLIPASSKWIIQSVSGINNRGQILGEGRFHGKRQTFLMTPIAAATK